MNLLILGGTIFLGKHLTAVALERGHTVTLFNRGRHANPFPEVEAIRGDRDGGLDALAGRQWDTVIDTSGYIPRLVRASAEALANAVNQYVFISTISVYADMSAPGVDETARVGHMDDPTTEQVTGESYGPLKALCEQAVEDVFRDHALVIRPGLIVGPDDPTDRFTYWVRRGAQGGAVLAPGRPDRAIQVIDVRDLAEWTLNMVEANASGTYNITGPATRLTMDDLLQAAQHASGSDAHFIWADEAWLQAQGVEPWSEMPLWIPENDPALSGMMALNIDRALAAGATFRPIAATVRDTLAWDNTRPPTTTLKAGLLPEREASLIAAWRESRQ